MSNRGIRADHSSSSRRHVEDTVVLHVTPRTDHDSLFAMVGSQHRAVPDAGVFPHGDIADEYGCRGDESSLRDQGPVTLELDDHVCPLFTWWKPTYVWTR